METCAAKSTNAPPATAAESTPAALTLSDRLSASVSLATFAATAVCAPKWTCVPQVAFLALLLAVTHVQAAAMRRPATSAARASTASTERELNAQTLTSAYDPMIAAPALAALTHKAHSPALAEQVLPATAPRALM